MMDLQHGILPPMATPRGTATAAEIVDERHEVIRGALVPKEAASFEHGATQRALGAALDGISGRTRAGRPGGWWLGTEVEIELEPHEVYVPDLAGWRMDRVPEPPSGKPVRVRPDWVCEVLSPSTMKRDLGHKQRTYHRAGVDHYWVVEPVVGVLWVYRRAADGYTLVSALEADEAVAGELVRIEPFDTIGIDLANIFTR
jgi:Uma2 family endonuclease